MIYKKFMYERHIWPDMKNASDACGSHVWALSLMSSKTETLEVVFWVFIQVRVSVFRCTYTLTRPFTTQTNTLKLTHHLLSRPYPQWRTLSLFLFKGGVQQWSGTGLFLVGVKLWPGLKAAAIRSPPQREVMVWDPFWTSTCWENFTLDTLFRPSSTLQRRRRDVTFKLTLSDQTLFLPSFEGDLDSWTMPNGEELLIHMVRHMDGTEGNTFCFHLQDYWNVCSIMHSQHFRQNSLAVSLPLFYIKNNPVSFPCALNPKCHRHLFRWLLV